MSRHWNGKVVARRLLVVPAEAKFRQWEGPMATMVTLAQDKPFIPAASGSHACGYCRCSIMASERWVREKIYEPLTDAAPRYLRYHADLFGDEELSCWEKHQMEENVARES